MKLCEAFAHYYNERGKGEVASFVQTWVSAFGVAFSILTFTDLQALFSGSVEKDLISLAMGFVYAFGRSVLGGLAFAIVRSVAPTSVQTKLQSLLLRTPDKK